MCGEIFEPNFGLILGPQNSILGVISGVIFLTSFWILFGPLLGPFWGPFWDQIGPRRGEDGPKRATKSFKDPKSCICKNLQNIKFSKVFGVQRPPKRGSRGP